MRKLNAKKARTNWMMMPYKVVRSPCWQCFSFVSWSVMFVVSEISVTSTMVTVTVLVITLLKDCLYYSFLPSKNPTNYKNCQLPMVNVPMFLWSTDFKRKFLKKKSSPVGGGSVASLAVQVKYY